MKRVWRSASFVHWPVPLTQVASRLPDGLTVDTFDGHAWVGLVPFEMAGIRFWRTSPGRWPGSFPETNIRTYVVGPDGPGVWFDSLDTSRLAPVAFARVFYGLPYNWAHMSVRRFGDVIQYELRRRWPDPNARSRIEVAIGNPIVSPSDLEVWLTARWRLYSTIGNRFRSARVSHEPWALHAAGLTSQTDGLMSAAGYQPLTNEPHVLFSPGVTVEVERPQHARPTG